jgi:hypothetical protein
MTRHGTARPSLTAGRWAKICKQATQSQIASDSSPGRHASANWRNILLQPPPFRTLSTRQGAHQRASTVTGVCLALASRGLRSVQQPAQRNEHRACLAAFPRRCARLCGASPMPPARLARLFQAGGGFRPRAGAAVHPAPSCGHCRPLARQAAPASRTATGRGIRSVQRNLPRRGAGCTGFIARNRGLPLQRLPRLPRRHLRRSPGRRRC